MNRTRWNDDLETYLDTLYYRKDEVDEMINRLELNSGLVFSVEVEDEIFSVDDGVQEFRANLSWSNGTGVEGKSVLFSVVDGEGNSIDSSLVVTDVDGYAVYEYTPIGRGMVFVTASYGMFLQETFVLWDTLYHDEATTGNKNSNYIISTSGVSVGDATDNGTPITYTTNSKVYTPSSNSAQLQFSAPICVEFDVVEVSNVRLRFHQSDSLYSDVHLSTGHYKIRIVENKKYVSKNGGTETESNFNYTSTFKMWMQSSSSTANITFKNLKVYSA